jgi:plastocyanin
MSRRLTVLLAAAAALSLTALAIGTATAAPQAPAKQKMAIVGHEVFKVGKFAFDNQRFSPRKFDIKSGGTVTLRNKAKSEAPHTISLVKKSQLPTSFDCPVCDEIFAAHGPSDHGVANPVVDVGATGFDQPGDSIFIPPHGKVSFDVTAAKGTTLHFMCGVHPWMQGRIRVR